MYYIYIDGDDIGLDIEKSLIENNEESLQQINKEIDSLTQKMSSYLVNAGFSVLFRGADGVICKGENIDISGLTSYIKEISHGFTFSIGAALNLREAFLALRYAKSIGKDRGVVLADNKFTIIQSKNSE